MREHGELTLQIIDQVKCVQTGLLTTLMLRASIERTYLPVNVLLDLKKRKVPTQYTGSRNMCFICLWLETGETRQMSAVSDFIFRSALVLLVG